MIFYEKEAEKNWVSDQTLGQPALETGQAKHESTEETDPEKRKTGMILGLLALHKLKFEKLWSIHGRS